MFSALVDNPSLVEGAITKGLFLLKFNFDANKTGESHIPLLNFAIVFPVQGAIIIISLIFLNKSCSTSFIV